MRLLYLITCIVLGFLLLSAPAFATDNAFSVSGKVIDRYGNPVTGANVTLVDNSYKVIGEKMTNDAGVYDFVNVLSDTDTVTVRVNFTRDGKSYMVPAYYTRWYPSNGISLIPSNETQLPGYPEPTFGYLYGAILTDLSSNGRFINGVAYLVSPDDNVKYYQFADKTDGKASFVFYVPPGTYTLYAQHRENGLVYESAHKQVTVGRNSDISEAPVTSIVLPLNTPSSNPVPAILPTHQSNKVSGTVLTADDKPLSGLTVTLLQRTDNMTTFIPMVGPDGKPVTATTDNKGYYEFNGVIPTTDDGKVIQTNKGIRAEAKYFATENLTYDAVSEEKVLYYPDVLMGSGRENEARNIVFSPMIISTVPNEQMPAVPTTTGPSNIALMPLLAALVIGLVCLGGMYWFLNGKGR